MGTIVGKVFVLIYTSLFLICICSGESPPLAIVQNIFEALGYSPSCVAVALASCTTDWHSLPQTNNLKKSRDMLYQTGQYPPRNCANLQELGENKSGIRTVYPFTCCPNRLVQVYCDQTTDGGGWTVFQRRDALPIREDFYRTWLEYVLGFGNLTGEFWLGLDNIHALVSTTLTELRVDLEDYEGEKRWTKYGKFYIGDLQSKYILTIGCYSGDAGDSLSAHSGYKFSTYDANSHSHSVNCAKMSRGAWWYTHCHDVNLNGFQYNGTHGPNKDGINWNAFKGHYYSLKKSVMGIRPKFRNH